MRLGNYIALCYYSCSRHLRFTACFKMLLNECLPFEHTSGTGWKNTFTVKCQKWLFRWLVGSLNRQRRRRRHRRRCCRHRR